MESAERELLREMRIKPDIPLIRKLRERYNLAIMGAIDALAVGSFLYGATQDPKVPVFLGYGSGAWYSLLLGLFVLGACAYYKVKIKNLAESDIVEK